MLLKCHHDANKALSWICGTFWIMSILQVWLCQCPVNGSGELIADKIRSLQVFTFIFDMLCKYYLVLGICYGKNLNHQTLTANSKVAVNHLWHHMISKPAFTFVASNRILQNNLFVFVFVTCASTKLQYIIEQPVNQKSITLFVYDVICIKVWINPNFFMRM